MKRIVFAGGGHANIAALRRLRRRPVKAELVLVNDGRFAWYTGALPGLIRGDILPEQARVDLGELAARCGAKFVDVRVAGFENSLLRLEDLEPLAFDALALAVGGAKIAGGVKPIPAFLARVAALETMAAPRAGILGAGVAGVELALALRQRLGARAEIFIGGKAVLAAAPARVRRIAAAALRESGIAVVEILPEGLDDVVRAYTPAPEIMIEPTLLVTGERNVFAGGDCAKFVNPLPRSGAIAVRQGKVLAENLRRCLEGGALQAFQAPQRVLAIMGLSGQKAVAWYGGVSVCGTLPMRVKAWIDGRWVK